jgi:hypothetical protein
MQIKDPCLSLADPEMKQGWRIGYSGPHKIHMYLENVEIWPLMPA